MVQLSDRVLQLKTSATLAVTAKARALKASGANVISFGAGEPDFDTPSHIVESACQALRGGHTRYEDTAGTPQAREAVAQYFNERFHVNVSKDNVIISTGAKNALYLAFMAVMNPGDEMLLPSPYWVSYPEQAGLAGATVKIIPGAVENDFKITAEQLRQAITEKSRVLMLCSPSNPAGTAYTHDELAALAEVILEHPNLYVFSDEIYERLVYGQAFTSFASLSPEVAQRTVTFNGVSKAYAMTGWRVGYAVAEASLIKAMIKLQGQMTSNITAFNMPALVTALTGSQEPVEAMRQQFALRAQRIHELMCQIPGVFCPKPTGAFYVFPDISKAAFGKTDANGTTIHTAQEFATALLEQELVAVVPGEAFGSPNHVRLSFACSTEQIEEGMKRFTRYITSLK